MTHVLPASRPRREPARVDPVRILGYSTAIAVNTIAAALLVMPLRAPPPAPPVASPPVWILPATPVAPVPPPTAPPVAPTRQPRTTPPTVAPAPSMPAPVVVDQGTLPAPPVVTVTGAAAPSLATPQATTGAAPMELEYAVAPAPPYPRQALRDGDEGLVLLQVLVDVDGRPLQVDVAQGSGHRALDLAARRHVLAHWRFRPATSDGRPVRAIGLVPIEFSLD